MSSPDLGYESFLVGAEVTRQYTVTPELYERFLDMFGDLSPVHVDEEYARARRFKGKVIHGAILNGFLSHFVGMHCIGRRSLELSVDMRYGNPSYVGDVVEFRAVVAQKVDSQKVIVLNLKIANLTQRTIAATGRVQVGMADS
jgi:acyl dehydratase